MDVTFRYKDTISIAHDPNKWSKCAFFNAKNIDQAINHFGFRTDKNIVDWEIESINGEPAH